VDVRKVLGGPWAYYACLRRSGGLGAVLGKCLPQDRYVYAYGPLGSLLGSLLGIRIAARCL